MTEGVREPWGIDNRYPRLLPWIHQSSFVNAWKWLRRGHCLLRPLNKIRRPTEKFLTHALMCTIFPSKIALSKHNYFVVSSYYVSWLRIVLWPIIIENFYVCYIVPYYIEDVEILLALQRDKTITITLVKYKLHKIVTWNVWTIMRQNCHRYTGKIWNESKDVCRNDFNKFNRRYLSYYLTSSNILLETYDLYD